MSLFRQRTYRDEVVADLRAALALADARYEALLDKYHALKTAGAVVVPESTPTLPVPLEQPDELRALIDERCGSDYRKRSMMLRQLAADRRDGLDDDAIRRAIETGVESDGVPL